MFPIRDHNPSGQTPHVTYALMLINIGVFLGYWLTISSPFQINAYFLRWGLVPRDLFTNDALYTLFTYMFLHGGWMHLAGNMLFLWIFGDNVEDIMGHARFLAFYLLCGVAAGLLQVFSDPGSATPVVGASGAIAGVLGGYLLLFPRAKVDILLIFLIFFRIFSVPAFVMLILWFAIQLGYGLIADSAKAGVAYWAHIGGFGFGILAALPFWLSLGGKAFWHRTHGAPPHDAARYHIGKTSIPRVPRRK